MEHQDCVPLVPSRPDSQTPQAPQQRQAVHSAPATWIPAGRKLFGKKHKNQNLKTHIRVFGASAKLPEDRNLL